MRPTRLQRNWWHDGACSSTKTAWQRSNSDCAQDEKKKTDSIRESCRDKQAFTGLLEITRADTPANNEKNQTMETILHSTFCLRFSSGRIFCYLFAFLCFACSNNGQRHTLIQAQLMGNVFDFRIMSKNLFFINLLSHQTRTQPHSIPNAVAVIIKELNHHRLCAIVGKNGSKALWNHEAGSSTRTEKNNGKKSNANQFQSDSKFVCVQERIASLCVARRDSNRWRLIHAMESDWIKVVVRSAPNNISVQLKLKSATDSAAKILKPLMLRENAMII